MWAQFWCDVSADYKMLLEYILKWNTWFWSLHGHYVFQETFSMAFWILLDLLDPSKEAVTCKIKHTNNKFAV